MFIAELLTMIFTVLKMTHTIDWSWWLVLLPELIAAGFYAVLAVGRLVRKR